MIVCCWSFSVFAEVGVGIKGGWLFPDQDPFKDEFDSNFLVGGVIELDSNLGITLEADVEYFQQDSDDSVLGGEISIIPIIFSAKYNFLPRHRTTPFVGIGIGAYFFDREFGDGSDKSKTKFGARVSAGLRFFEDRRVNVVIEGARNFVDFDDTNASSFQATLSIIVDLNPSIIGGP
jgi:outer membrane protein W